MQRVKNIDYDEDDLYDDADYEEQDEGYTEEDRNNFTALTPVVRAELEEAGLQASDREIEDALWNYYWDVGKSVTFLKNNRKPKTPQQQVPKKEKPKSKFDEAAEKSAQESGSIKPATKQNTNGLVKKTEGLKLEGNAAPQPSQPKVKSRGLDVPKLWEEEEARRKPSAAFVVIGHVDHGKSTLMGRLLLDTGAVAQRDIDKYQKQATELGKSSFALAWVMDTGTEERERGVTFDFAQHHFSTESTDFTILDAPGHRDFVPNMIGGASIADLAVLVVDANQLESGMKGQTKEHILLAKAVGLDRIIVAVNKLDSTTPVWIQEAFEKVQVAVRKLLREAGFKEDRIVFVPCSGLSGQNVAKSPSGKGLEWITQAKLPSLLQALEASSTATATPENMRKPLRMQVVDLFRGSITNPLSVSGRISSGSLQIGDAITFQPAGESATVKAIEVSDDGKEYAVAGQICTLHLQDMEAQHIKPGDVVCSSSSPVAVVKDLTLLINVVDALLPQPVDVHVGRLHVPGIIKQLIETVDQKGDQLKKKPRLLKEGQRARVKVRLEEGAPIEAGERVVLRSGGVTAAYGVVIE